MKKLNKKGFTLAELLIVVAIIAVLVAISIPIFTAQLEKAREATDAANIRSAYAEVTANLLTWDGTSTIESKTIPAKQTQANWQTAGNAQKMEIGGQQVEAVTSGSSWTVSADTTNSKVVIAKSSS